LLHDGVSWDTDAAIAATSEPTGVVVPLLRSCGPSGIDASMSPSEFMFVIGGRSTDGGGFRVLFSGSISSRDIQTLDRRPDYSAPPQRGPTILRYPAATLRYDRRVETVYPSKWGWAWQLRAAWAWQILHRAAWSAHTKARAGNTAIISRIMLASCCDTPLFSVMGLTPCSRRLKFALSVENHGVQDKLECATTLADIGSRLTWKPKPPAQEPPVFYFVPLLTAAREPEAGPLRSQPGWWWFKAKQVNSRMSTGAHKFVGPGTNFVAWAYLRYPKKRPKGHKVRCHYESS
jgi:hypothetical protein